MYDPKGRRHDGLDEGLGGRSGRRRSKVPHDAAARRRPSPEAVAQDQGPPSRPPSAEIRRCVRPRGGDGVGASKAVADGVAVVGRRGHCGPFEVDFHTDPNFRRRGARA